jgi:uncharacterized membrane protein YdbT with pleckstrin-like domain
MPDVFVSPNVAPNENVPSTPPANSTRNPFSSFNLYPTDIDFETREDNEKIILMLRQHPIINIKWIFVSAILLIAPTLLSVFGFFRSLPLGYSLIITLCFYLIAVAYALEGFLSWYFNVYFVTSMRIIDIDFFNLINKKVSDAEVTKIQDVSYTSSGFLGAMFNFGNVLIQTAADIQEFKFESVGSPDKVAKILDDFMAKEK